MQIDSQAEGKADLGNVFQFATCKGAPRAYADRCGRQLFPRPPTVDRPRGSVPLLCVARRQAMLCFNLYRLPAFKVPARLRVPFFRVWIFFFQLWVPCFMVFYGAGP